MEFYWDEGRAPQIRTVDWSIDDIRPHVVLEIYWKKSNVQKMVALVDTGAEATLVYGNPHKFKGPFVPLSGLGGNVICGKTVTLLLKVGKLPIKKYLVLVTPVREWIIGMDVLAGMTLYL